MAFKDLEQSTVLCEVQEPPMWQFFIAVVDGKNTFPGPKTVLKVFYISLYNNWR